MRILVLIHAVPKSLGDKIPWHFFQELVPLAQRGHDLCVVSTNQPEYTLPGVEFRKANRTSLLRDPISALRAVGTVFKHWSALPRVGNLKDIRSLLVLCQWSNEISHHVQRFQPDVIHSHWAMPAGSGGYLAARSESVPFVMTLRGCDHLKSEKLAYGDCLNPFYENTLKRAVATADALTICCETSRTRLVELGVSAHDERIVKLFHAVDESRFADDPLKADEWKSRYGLTNRRIITCVALMDGHRKGHDTLLRAFKAIHADDPSLALVLVGDGSLRHELEGTSRQLGLDSDVIFTGRVHPRDVQHVVRMAELTVLPTHLEVFGNVVFESLLLGVPVISGNVGAAADVFTAHDFGLLFEPGHTNQLVSAMRRILQAPEEYRERARRGGEFVRQNMSVAKRVDGFIEVYERILAARRGVTMAGA